MKTANDKDKWIMIKIVLFYIGTLVAVYLIIALLAHVIRTQKPWENFSRPDDTKAARALLAEKFTGPAYFQTTGETAISNISPPYISVLQAKEQMPAIIKERQLSYDATSTFEKLIDSLSEPASSRITGMDRVNALQLNLALDEMK